MFREVTATSSLDLSAWAIAKAPSSCVSGESYTRGVTTSVQTKIEIAY